jgi:hypothetical protein
MKKIIAVALSLLIASPAFSWGPIGHRTVALLAEKELDYSNIKRLREILDNHTLPMVSTWADEMRSDESFKAMSNWHYVNIDNPKDFKPDTVQGHALKAIDEQCAVLKNKKSSKEQKAVAVKWLVHVIGDLHQPLHSGMASDRGGNSVILPWFDKVTNLHAIWDDHMIDDRKLSFTEQTDFLLPLITKEHRNKASDKPVDWVLETLALRDIVYSYPKKTTVKWEYDYMFKTKKILDEQLIKGGLRLAHTLNKCL